MDPAVRQAQRIQAGIEATQDAANPGWLLQLNSNATGSVNIHDGYAHYTSEAATDNGVLTQDRRIYSALVNSGMYSSSTQNVGSYLQTVLSLNPVSHWRMGETGNQRIATDLTGGQMVNLMPNSSMESATPAWSSWTYWPSTVTQSRAEAHSGSYSIAISTPTSPAHTGATGVATPFTPTSGTTYSIGLWFMAAVSGAYNIQVGDAGTTWFKNTGSINYTAGVWYWVTIPSFAPTSSGTLYISINASQALISGQTHYIDDVVVVLGSTVPPSYFSAGSGDAVPANLITNSDFEADAAGWGVRVTTGAAAYLTASAAGVLSGNKSARVIGTMPPSQDCGAAFYSVPRVPVQPGVSYAFSILAKVNATQASGTLELRVDWYDANVSYLATYFASRDPSAIGSIPLSSSTLTRLSGVGVAPANAAIAVPYITATHPSSTVAVDFSFDECFFSPQPTFSGYYPGNGGNDGDYINPTYAAAVLSYAPNFYLRVNESGNSRVAVDQLGTQMPNLISNPSVEVDLTQWSFGGAASTFTNFAPSTGWAQDGLQSVRVTGSLSGSGEAYVRPGILAGTSAIPASPNITYTFSIYVNILTNSNVGWHARILFFNSAGSALADVSGTNFTGTGVTRLTLTSTAPANTAYVEARITTSPTTATSFDLYADAAQLTATPAAVSYYEDSGGNNGDYIASFYGNLVSNPSFESGIAGWTAAGNYFVNTYASLAQTTAAQAFGSNSMSVVQTVRTPSGLTATPVTSGGTFVAGTYFYLVTAYTTAGESVGSNEVSAVVAANGSVTLSWGGVGNVTGYNIYRATVAGGESTSPAFVAAVPTGTLTYTDTGIATTAGAVPATNTCVPQYQGAWYTTGFAATSGQGYTLSVFLKGAVGGEVAQIAIGTSSAQLSASTSLTMTTTWTRYSLTATATATGTLFFGVRFPNMVASPGTIYVDAVQVTGTPYAVPYSDTTGAVFGQAGAIAGSGDTDKAVAFSNGYIATRVAVVNPALFSLTFWFSTTGTNQGLMGFSSTAQGNGPAHDRGLWIDSAGKLNFAIYTTAWVTITSTASFNDGNWHHVVAVVAANGNMTLYADGVSVASNTNTAAPQSYTGYWQIGSAKTSLNTVYNLTGSVDEIAVYYSALSPAAVWALYWLGKAAGITWGQTGALAGGGETDKAVTINNGAYVNCGNGPSLQLSATVTIAAWYKSSAPASGTQQVAIKTPVYACSVNNGQLSVYDWVANTWRSAGPVLNDGAWHFLVVTWRSGVTNGTGLYVDGVNVANVTASSQAGSPQGNPFTIGWEWNQVGKYASATIDEVSVFNYTLTAAQVSALYAAR